MGADFNYHDTSHQVIFDRINGGTGSDALQEAGRAWERLGNDIGVTSKSYAQSAIRGILTAREGAAAVAAIGAMVPWMDDVKVIATSAAKRAQGQAEHWVTAKNSVPPVPPAPHSALTHHR